MQVSSGASGTGRLLAGLVIVFVLAGLAWFGWQYYQTDLMRLAGEVWDSVTRHGSTSAG